MRQSQEQQRHPQSSAQSLRTTADTANHIARDVKNVVIVPQRPEVVILSAPDPLQQLPSLVISLIALGFSLYSLRKTLAQKRNEHRANFFHEVVVGSGLSPLLRFYENLRRYVEKQGAVLMKSSGSAGHDKDVMVSMRKVREMKRSAATQICGLVSPFSTRLESEIQSFFDAAADAAIEYLEECASGTSVTEPIARRLATCQRNTIERLREHEFQLGWPPFWERFQRPSRPGAV